MSPAVMSKVAPVFRLAFTDPSAFDCAKQAVACLIAIAGYVGGIAGLIAACPETIGLSCVGALLLHPILGAWVAFSCADVVSKCDVKKPTTEPHDDLQLLWL